MYTEEELWAAISEQAHLDDTLDQAVSVRDLAHSWLSRDRLPVISVTRNYDKNTLVVMQVSFFNFLRKRRSNIVTKKISSATVELIVKPTGVEGKQDEGMKRKGSAWLYNCPKRFVFFTLEKFC